MPAGPFPRVVERRARTRSIAGSSASMDMVEWNLEVETKTPAPEAADDILRLFRLVVEYSNQLG